MHLVTELLSKGDNTWYCYYDRGRMIPCLTWSSHGMLFTCMEQSCQPLTVICHCLQQGHIHIYIYMHAQILSSTFHLQIACHAIAGMQNALQTTGARIANNNSRRQIDGGTLTDSSGPAGSYPEKVVNNQSYPVVLIHYEVLSTCHDSEQALRS